MSKVYLILSIHNHQPVGNFDHVLEDAYEKAYLPFLKMLALHPKLKLVLHYSGNLLVWLGKKHPEAIDMITALIRAGRVELLSGGFYEPVLCSLPEDDRVMQIREMTAYIKDTFGYTPRGMWLAERVWEPHMPKCISKAGIEYLPVDDYHFKLAGVNDRDLLGYHVTEENGFMVKVFPGSEELRYSIPFKDVDNVMSYLKEVSMTGGSPLLTLADDGEKFGVWPETFSHCYKNGWLENFFSALEKNSDWIETTTFSEYQERFYPVGMVYLPAASYREMGEWALPPDGALDYEYALNELKGLFGDRAKSFLRGGTWRSFFAKYPESASSADSASNPKSANDTLAPAYEKNSEIVVKDGFYYITEPVFFQEKQIGLILIKANNDAIVYQKYKLILTLSLLVLLLLFVSYLLVSAMQKLVSEPILNLTQLTTAISKNQNFTVQVEQKGKDEVGFLYEQFNNMLSQLLKRQN
ncbi:MAG: HAMP domain-containing protein, partial [Nitrospirae bacterium]|nr:HAMP domain-containing protein [Nitrospirota bacterium]